MESVSEWKKKRGAAPLSGSGVTPTGTGKISNLLDTPPQEQSPVSPKLSTGLVPVSEWKKTRPAAPAPVTPQVEMPQSTGNTIADNYKIYSDGLKKVSGAIAGGLYETAGASIEGMEWLGKKIMRTAGADVSKLGGAGEAINDFFKDVARVNRPTDERFTKNLVEGTGLQISWNDILGMFGSMAAFIGPAKAVQIAGGAGAASGVLANFTMTALESGTEAGAVYDELLAKGVPESEADKKANRTFISNLIVNAILNKFAGYFDENTKTYLRSVLQGVVAEGSQESIQQIISNMNTDRPPFEGVPESGILGGLMGGSTGAFSKLVGTGEPSGKLPEKQKAPIPEDRKEVPVESPAPTSAEEMQLKIEEEARRATEALGGETNITNNITVEGQPAVVPENITVGYRAGESVPPRGKSAQDILTYEQVDLGNKDVVAVPGIDLSQIKAENTLWLTRTKQQAERYGDEIQEVKGNFRVLAVDSEGGVLVEKVGTPVKASQPKAKTKVIGKKYTPGSRKIAEIFNKSTDQTPVAQGKTVPFVIGTFGKNHQNRKMEEKKYDRFEESELADTLKNVTEAFRASNDETNYRSDNIVWVSKMPNGELRAVYTRKNAKGDEEIIAWHKIAKQKAEKYISTLRSYGIPERNRTSNLSVRSGTLYPLGDGDSKSIPQKAEKKQATEKKSVKKAWHEKLTEDALAGWISFKTGLDFKKKGTNFHFFKDGKEVAWAGFTVYTGKESFTADDGVEFPNSISIDSLYAKKKGTGIGTKIVDAIEDYANKNSLDVVINNDTSEGYWESLGYEQTRSLARSKDFGGTAKEGDGKPYHESVYNVMEKSASLNRGEDEEIDFTDREIKDYEEGLKMIGFKEVDETPSEGFVIQANKGTSKDSALYTITKISDLFGNTVETENGNLVLYHGTNVEKNAKMMIRDIRENDASGRTYFAHTPERDAGRTEGASAYGKYVVRVVVDPRYVELNGLGEFMLQEQESGKNDYDGVMKAEMYDQENVPKKPEKKATKEPAITPQMITKARDLAKEGKIRIYPVAEGYPGPVIFYDIVDEDGAGLMPFVNYAFPDMKSAEAYLERLLGTKPGKGSPKDAVAKISKKISEKYGNTPAYQIALDVMNNEIDIAEVSIIQTQEGGYIRSSTYPKWIPDSIKKAYKKGGLKKFVQKMSENISETVVIPHAKNATNQRIMLDVMLARVDAMTGVDTSALRQEAYDAIGDEIKAEKADTSNPIKFEERSESGQFDDVFQRLSPGQKKGAMFGVLKDNPTYISEKDAMDLWRKWFPENDVTLEFSEKLYDFAGNPVAGVTLKDMTRIANGEKVAIETVSHEAVHRFLMSFTNPKMRSRYQEKAWQALVKERGPEDIQKQLLELNESYRGRLKVKQLQNILAEEYLADNFLQYLEKQSAIQKMPFFRRLFEKVKKFLLRLTPDSIDALYNDIATARRRIQDRRDFWQGQYFQAMTEKYTATTKTLKFIEGAIKKDRVQKSVIESYLNREGTTAMDKEIIKDALNSIDGDEVNVGEFLAAAYARIVPLNMIKSQHWATYGTENLKSIKQKEKGLNQLQGSNETHVWDAPDFFYDYSSRHFSELYSGSMSDLKESDFEIKQSFGEEDGYTANAWLVMRKRIGQYEESDVVNVASSKEEAEEWLKEFVKKGAGGGVGHFGHTRVIYVPPKKGIRDWINTKLEPYRISADMESRQRDMGGEFKKKLLARSDEFADLVIRKSISQPLTGKEAKEREHYTWYRDEELTGFLAGIAGEVGLTSVPVSEFGPFLTNYLIPINGGQIVLHGRQIVNPDIWWTNKDKKADKMDGFTPLDPAIYFKEKKEDRMVAYPTTKDEPINIKDFREDFRQMMRKRIEDIDREKLEGSRIIPSQERLNTYQKKLEQMREMEKIAGDEGVYYIIEVQGDPWQASNPYRSAWVDARDKVKDYENLLKILDSGVDIPSWSYDASNLEGKIMASIKRYNDDLFDIREGQEIPISLETREITLAPGAKEFQGKYYLSRIVKTPDAGYSEIIPKDVPPVVLDKIRSKMTEFLDKAKKDLAEKEKNVTLKERQFVAMGAKFHERALREEFRYVSELARESGSPIKVRIATPFTISLIEGHLRNRSDYFVDDKGVLHTPATASKDRLNEKISAGNVVTKDNLDARDYGDLREKVDALLKENIDDVDEATADELQQELDNRDAFVIINGDTYGIRARGYGDYVFEMEDFDIAPYEFTDSDLSVGDTVNYDGMSYIVVKIDGSNMQIAREDRVRVGDVDEFIRDEVEFRIDDTYNQYSEEFEKVKGSQMAQDWLDGKLEIDGKLVSPPDDWIAEKFAQEMVDKDKEDVTFDDVREDVEQAVWESESDYAQENLQNNYSEVFFSESRYGSATYYGVQEDANLSDFYTPDAYNKTKDDALWDGNVVVTEKKVEKEEGEKKEELAAPTTNKRGEYLFNPKDLQDGRFGGEAYYVHKHYDSAVIPWYIKTRKDAKLHTDERAIQWWETVITPEEYGPVEAFQRLPDDPMREKISPIEFPELVRLATDLMGDYPKVPKRLKAKLERGNFRGRGDGEIALSPDIFDPAKQENGFQFARTLAHEIGHLIDWLPDKTLNRGNVLGRLASLRDFRSEFLPDHPGRENKPIREELYNLSKKWRPFDENNVPESFLKYRKSGKEIYADFISALFNDPALVRNDAPQAYNLFFQKLDAKPEVRDAYFGLQLELRNMPDVFKARREGVQDMFKKADYNSVVKQEIQENVAEARRKSLWQRFKYDYVDVTEPIREKVREAQKKGPINPDERPDLLLEEYNYLGGLIKGTIEEDFQPIYQELEKEGLSIENLGEMLFYERILFGDRGNVANPGGLQPDFVTELYGDIGFVPADGKAKDFSQSMQTQLGQVKFDKLRALAARYRKVIKDIMLRGHKEGLYSDELAQLMQDNSYYVPFRGARYSGDRMSFAVKHQVGTLGPIENPAITGLVKTVEVIRAIERNKSKKATIELLKPLGDVMDARTLWNGRFNEPIDPQDKNLELVTVMDGGKVKGYYMDKYIARSFERSSTAELGLATSALRVMNSMWYRPVFITFNLGFQSFNLVRDFFRYWKNIPGMTIPQAVRNYWKAKGVARVRTFGLPENPTKAQQAAHEELIQLEKERILGITMNDMLMGREQEDTQLESILKQYHVIPKEAGRFGRLSNTTFFGGVDKVLTFIENLGNFIETLPKVAGVYALDGKMPPAEMRSYVRRKIGSPDFLSGGRNKNVMNEVFLFSNAIIQGIRADAEVATDPTTRSGYWYKTAKVNIVPKLLMFMALAGLLGEELKKLFGNVSEYDLTNYTVIPLGLDQNGKTMYIRIPSDETGRFLGGIFWKGLKIASGDAEAWKTLQQVLSYTGGQLPSVTPVIEGAVATMQFLAGQNPYDFFRGRNVLTDQEFQAGGVDAAKKFGSYLFEQMGGGVFVKLYNYEPFPKQTNAGEWIFEIPVAGNVANRWVKVSSVGNYQRDREVIQDIRQENARESLKTQRIMFDYLEAAQGKTPAEIAQIERDMINEAIGKIDSKEKKQDADRLRKRFRLLLIRGEASPEIDMIASVSTNEEKAALLARYRERMDQAEFDSMVRFLMGNKIISADVLKKMYGLEAQ